MNNSESYEAMLKRLEETVRRLEEGKLTLDESIALYSEGISVYEKCGELLKNAQLKVSLLGEKGGAAFTGGEDTQ